MELDGTSPTTHREGDWRILEWESRDPYRNLALEEALLLKVGEGRSPDTVRLWRNPDTVVIGRFQSVALEVDVEACRRYGIYIVRRLSGGGTVYHDLGNLNWTIVVRRSDPAIPRDLTGIYKVFGETVSRGINSLAKGLGAKFTPPNMISIDGLKISGMASTVKREAILCHGTLLINSNLERLRSVLKRPDTSTKNSRYTRSRWAEVANLSSILGRTVSVGEVKEAILKAFQALLSPLKGFRGHLSVEEEVLTEKLFKEKYGTLHWNLSY